MATKKKTESGNQATMEKEQVVIDHPTEGEAVPSSHYAFRMRVNFDAARVEVSLDGGKWQSCREAIGLWWFDWQGKSGEHTMQARAQNTADEWVTSPKRHFSCS